LTHFYSVVLVRNVNGITKYRARATKYIFLLRMLNGTMYIYI